MEDTPQPKSDERLNNLGEALDNITRIESPRPDQAVEYLRRAGEIELSDRLRLAVAKRNIDYTIRLSEELLKDYSTQKAEGFLGYLLHGPSNFYASSREDGYHTNSHFMILAKLLAVCREIRGNRSDTLRASRLYEDLGDSGKAEDLLRKGKAMDPDVFENTPEFDIEIKSAIQNFVNDIGYDPIMLVDHKRLTEEVVNELRQKIGN